MVIDLPRPQPAPISSLSPTAANDLLACPYRLAWRLDPRSRALRRPSPRSSLGVVAHAVAEEVANGLLADSMTMEQGRAIVEARWAKHEADAREQLSRRWAPAHPPSPTDWPGYHLVRARTIRKSLRLMNVPRPSVTTTRSALVEVSLTAAETGLTGRPDRVEGASGNRCVVDLKTGLSQQGATDSQRRQLLIYCHLVADATGDMPKRIAIEDPSGRRWEEAVGAGAVENAIAAVQDARRAYELAASDDVSTLATPSADTCRHCAYRLVCTPYWQALETPWEHGSVAGQVVEVRSNTRGATVVIYAESPTDAKGPDWLVTSVPPDERMGIGPATVVDADVTGAPRHLRWRWSTLTWPTVMEGPVA